MISSSSNDRIKRVRALQSSRQARRKQDRFVIEGPHLVEEALRAGAPIEDLLYTPEFAAEPEGLALIDRISRTGATAIAVDESVMREMSDTLHPQGLLAVLPSLKLSPPQYPSFALVLDAVSDPGNLGTILRSAAAVGAPLAIATAGTVDLYNPKVLRAAAGAHFQVPVQSLSWPGLQNLLSRHVILLADPHSGTPYSAFDWTQPCALIVSEEAHGASAEARAAAHVQIRIPMPGHAESLNVAMATTVLLFEMLRQRSAGG